MAKKEKETPEKKESKKVSEQQQKRDAAQAEALRNQKALARNQSLDLLDSVASQVQLDRAGHRKLQVAVQNLRVGNMELEAFEKGVKQEETEEE